MKILLVQPYDRTSAVRLFGRLFMSQLTLPYLAGLIPEQHEVRIADENVGTIDYDWPDVVGITAMTMTVTRAYIIADEFRRRGKKVVLGGVHPTHMPEEALGHADAVVVGEAEGVIQEVLTDFEAGISKGIYLRNEKPDLAGLPVPRHDLVDVTKYVDIPKVETSRGCPFNCSFCSTTAMFGKRMRYRPVEDVVAELQALGLEQVFFTDNNIFGSPKYAKALFEALVPLKIKWFSQASLNMARDEELLKLAAKSGCAGLLIGFESLGDQVIESLGKRVNRVSEYAQDIKRLHKHKIGIIGCFVFGFDEDDGQIIDRTVKFVKKTNVDIPQFTVLTPFPGTQLRAGFEADGRILHNDWEQYDTAHTVFAPKAHDAEQLQEEYLLALRRVFSWPQIARRTLRSALYFRSPFRISLFLGINSVYRVLFTWALQEVSDEPDKAEQRFIRGTHLAKMIKNVRLMLREDARQRPNECREKAENSD